MIEIIAEIAHGYEGSPKLTELLTKGSLESDADSIKFQLVYADELATPDYEDYYLITSPKELERKDSLLIIRKIL